jgi:hypothetical protein
VFNLFCLAISLHWLAGALERTSSEPLVQTQAAGARRWWALRLLPLLVCLPPVGHTLMRGQVNLLLLLLLSGMVSALARGHSARAGLWLAGAICLKIIPVYLLIYPVWRRDGRCLAACLLGLFLGLGVVPALVFGPAQVIAYFHEWDNSLFRPTLADGNDQKRAEELTNVNATESQSFLAVLHNTLHPDRAERPARSTATERLVHWLIGGTMTGLTLLVAGWRQARRRMIEAVFLATLVLLMPLLSPICHLHYFCLSLPLVMGILALRWDNQTTLRLPAVWWCLFAIHAIALALPHFQGLTILRDLGVAMYATLLLWLAGSVLLWKQCRTYASGFGDASSESGIGWTSSGCTVDLGMTSISAPMMSKNASPRS